MAPMGASNWALRSKIIVKNIKFPSPWSYVIKWFYEIADEPMDSQCQQPWCQLQPMMRR